MAAQLHNLVWSVVALMLLWTTTALAVDLELFVKSPMGGR